MHFTSHNPIITRHSIVCTTSYWVWFCFQISNSFIDDTATSGRSTSFAPVPSPSKFIRSDIRESDYESDFDGRIPPIWRPSDSEPDEPIYRPVRPILQSSTPQRPQYHRTTSADAAFSSSTKFSDTKANFKPVSPAVEYCTSVKIKPSPTFNDQFTQYQTNSSSQVRDKQYSRSYSGGGDSSALRNDVQKQSWQRGGHDGNYEERSSKAEYVDQSSFTEYHSEVKKVQKVEEIRKRFESKSSSFSGDLPITHGDADSLSRSRLLTDNFSKFDIVDLLGLYNTECPVKNATLGKTWFILPVIFSLALSKENINMWFSHFLIWKSFHAYFSKPCELM